MKLIYLDTETTGFDPKVNGLVQLAGCIEIDGKVVEKFDWKMKPVKDDVVYAESAAEKTGYTKELIESSDEFKDPVEVFNEFYAILEKYGDRYAKKTDPKLIPVGYNVSFDTDFLIQWFKDLATNEKDKMYGNGFFNFFSIPGLDVMQLALIQFLEKRFTFPNFQLGTVCQAVGLKWEENEAHNALYDIRQTRALFHVLTNRKYLAPKE